jgi:hypothetical protein
MNVHFPEEWSVILLKIEGWLPMEMLFFDILIQIIAIKEEFKFSSPTDLFGFLKNDEKLAQLLCRIIHFI